MRSFGGSERGSCQKAEFYKYFVLKIFEDSRMIGGRQFVSCVVGCILGVLDKYVGGGSTVVSSRPILKFNQY